MTTTRPPSYPGSRSGRCPYEQPADYAAWREREGLQRATLADGREAWVVTRHADVRAALADPRCSADSRNPNLPGNNLGFRSMARMDDPEHARLRRTLTGHFTVRQANLVRPRIEEVVHRFLDEMIGKGAPADFVREFALPVPSLVISILLGVPYRDHDFFQEKTATLFSSEYPDVDKKSAVHALVGYLHELLAGKGTDPADDIASQQAAHVSRGELTADEAAMNCLLVLIAGHESTSNMLALSVLALLQHPVQAARLRAADDARAAVEELLRYLSITENSVVRAATEDITIGGQLVRAGEGLILCLPAANHDPAFADQPGTLDVDRNARGHLAFGHGVHQCIGQSLARAELQIALPAVLRRLPDLRLAVPPEEIRFRRSINIGVHELQVAW
ncbi:cytochrome P450 [Lentzea tibetensis]|uniref:Cytochrome P450 n=1 Tax=Lentzea tibetensis TaxID=2591470 RepID=A0A563ESF1_9PSEU|nr:cytochrome P450 [Lentzea tibetensis]TWP50468.1 cytochrome P450 [Lentzea tibetensis]